MVVPAVYLMRRTRQGWKAACGRWRSASALGVTVTV